MTCPRLIEVALPIREISAESVRDKSLRQGHISTLHLWWARRPLAASRAVVFASLVPDPDHPECPAEFVTAVNRLLHEEIPSTLKTYGTGRRVQQDPDPYRPYEGIPDTPRNRLLTFIAKWSPEWLAFEKGELKVQPKPNAMLDDRSLAKWETSNPENDQGQEILRIARALVLSGNGGSVPALLDPFSGGGAIPLEAARLGCQAIANDYNPIAYVVLRATCEFPQKYGKPGMRSVEGQLQKEIKVENVLAHDVDYWAKWILGQAQARIGHLYPAGKDGKPVIGYIWARTAPCSNCREEIPLLRSLLICNSGDKKVALTMKAANKQLSFGIVKGEDVESEEGTMLTRGNCRCPACKQITPVADLRRAGREGKIGERLVAVIVSTPQGKDYRPVEQIDLEGFQGAERLAKTLQPPTEPILPEITGSQGTDISNSTGIRVHLYGMRTWGSLFNPRQLVAMETLISCLRESVSKLEGHMEPDYLRAIETYLAILISRIAQRGGRANVWNIQRETLEHPFSLAKISMTWDYPEANPFSESTGGAASGLNWILRVIKHESTHDSGVTPVRVYQGDGAKLPEEIKPVEIVVTDPPYFDEISYADLSDYFYVWLKRAIGEFYPHAFSTPLTPKADEATALKHRHGGNEQKAEKHFTSKLAACFAEAKERSKPSGVVAVMFAHQSTEAWTALINALFEAGLNIRATYPIETERANRPRGIDSSALASSITVLCRPRAAGAPASFKDVQKQIESVVSESVHRFWDYGFRGADLIVACYGPAVGVFGLYERVERRDGTPIEVADLLDLAKECALKAIAGEFTGDALSRLYFVWANLYGISEQSWDDARIVIQVGGDTEDAMEVARRRGLFVVEGPKCRLSLLKDRSQRPHMGDDTSSPLIDQLHHGMQLWKEERRTELVNYLRENELSDHAAFWKLAQALFEVLPRNGEDWKIISALLGERETLRTEARRSTTARAKAEALPFT